MNKFNLNFNGYWLEKSFESIAECSGIYIFQECFYNSVNDTVSLKRILYIGQATNCNNRIYNHEKIPAMKRSLSQGNQLCLTYCKCESKDLDVIENALIYYYRPPFNDTCKDTFEHEDTNISCTGSYSLLKQNILVYSTLRSFERR